LARWWLSKLGGLRAHRHRPRADPDQPRRDPSDELLRQSGAQHGSGAVRGGWALAQLWLFWVAPIVGALIAGATYHGITGEKNAAELAGERRETPDIQDA
jgi:hypothetical protein